MGRVRMGKPQGLLDWTLLIGGGVAILGAGPARGRVRLPFFGVFGPRPFGMPPVAWLGVAVALGAAYTVLQGWRGNFAIDDDGEDTTITLGLNEAGSRADDPPREAR